ncbi:predicted protein [Arabidopsis lyrata subsp. lyrata]|uniref:Predicted protein n=1 Tax=Arabidopsis lyrata subsp. lyrata TaxID=81972 RepID=D7MD09_ARALL|nr:predicted protein [Arabidopsis lyrata subsp. lyrata]
MGWIFKDPQKVVIQQGSSSRSFVASALVAEALAMKAAITAALALGVSRLACFSDCQVLVCLLAADGQANEIDGILEDIRRFGNLNNYMYPEDDDDVSENNKVGIGKRPLEVVGEIRQTKSLKLMGFSITYDSDSSYYSLSGGEVQADATIGDGSSSR